MPRFELAVVETDLSPPRFQSFLPGFARSLLKRRLRRTVSSGLQTGFTNYGRTLEVCVRRVVADIQRRFDSRADAYRAQLARMIDRRTLSPEQQAQTERDLADLEGLAAADALD